jgi:hypothetical protein
VTFRRPRRLVLVALAFVPAGIAAFLAADAGTGDFASARCFTGFDEGAPVRACAVRFPQLRAGLEAALAGWTARNAEVLQGLTDACGRGLAKVYRDLRIQRNEVARVRRAAERFVAQVRRQRDGESSDRVAGCRALEKRLLSEALTARHVEEVVQAPHSLSFMHALDPEFRRAPPPGAKYQRARGLHFRRSQELFSELKTGTTALAAECIGLALEACLRSQPTAVRLPSTPAQRERMPSGEDELTFAGKKTLFRGTLWDNHPVGREARVFVLRDGRIVEAWQSVQLLVGVAQQESAPPRYACETYGGHGTSPCSPRSVD